MAELDYALLGEPEPEYGYTPDEITAILEAATFVRTRMERLPADSPLPAEFARLGFGRPVVRKLIADIEFFRRAAETPVRLWQAGDDLDGGRETKPVVSFGAEEAIVIHAVTGIAIRLIQSEGDAIRWSTPNRREQCVAALTSVFDKSQDDIDYYADYYAGSEGR